MWDHRIDFDQPESAEESFCTLRLFWGEAHLIPVIDFTQTDSGPGDSGGGALEGADEGGRRWGNLGNFASHKRYTEIINGKEI